MLLIKVFLGPIGPFNAIQYMWPFIRYQSIFVSLWFSVDSKFNCSQNSRSAALRSQILCPVKIALLRLIHSTCSVNVPRLFTQLTSNLARTGLSRAFCFRSSIPAESKMTYRMMQSNLAPLSFGYWSYEMTMLFNEWWWQSLMYSL